MFTSPFQPRKPKQSLWDKMVSKQFSKNFQPGTQLKELLESLKQQSKK